MTKLAQLFKKHPAICWVLGFQIFRLLLLPFMGLMPQDAYYYLYGQHLSLSYFDHPGMIGYLLRIFSEFLGQSVFVVKFTDFCITSLTLFTFYKLASLFLSDHKVGKAMLLITSTLFISILSFNSTPDVPLILFWTLSILCLYKAIFEDKKKYWIWAGIAMGLAFNSKYTGLLLQFGLIAFLIFSNKYRRLFFSPWLWISLIISVAIAFPVWWWNYQNDFASFAFQSTERTGSISEFKLQPKNFFGALGHQMALLLPILFSVFIGFTFKHIRKAFLRFKLPSDQTLFLLAFFIPTFLGFMLLSPLYWVKLNWMMPSYMTGIIIAAMYVSRKLVKLQLIFSVVFHLALTLQVLFFLVPIKSDDTWVGWKELSQEVRKLQQTYPNTFVFSMDGYKTSAQLRFFLHENVYAQNVVGLKALHFDYLGDNMQDLKGQNALLIDSDKRFKYPDKNGNIDPFVASQFETVIELEPIITNPGTAKARKFWVFYCSKYQPKK